MAGMRGIGTMMVAGGVALSLAGCSRTSDGTVVVPGPVAMPSFNLQPAQRFVPSWMKRDEPEPVVTRDFPPPPSTKRSAPRRKTRPPVVTTDTGNLECKDVSEGGRVRMVCS